MEDLTIECLSSEAFLEMLKRWHEKKSDKRQGPSSALQRLRDSIYPKTDQSDDSHDTSTLLAQQEASLIEESKGAPVNIVRKKLKRRLKKRITRGLIVEALKLDDSGFIFTEDEYDSDPQP